MKTLLSLTSRTFGKNGVRVFFKEPNGMRAPAEGFTTTENSRRKQILAGTALAIAGVLGTSKAQAEGVNAPSTPQLTPEVAMSTVPPKADTSILTITSTSEPKVGDEKPAGSTEQFSVNQEELLSILGDNHKYPVLTTDAIQYLLAHPSDVRKKILDGELPLDSVFMKAYLSLNSLDASLKHTPLPKYLRHTLTGKILAEDITKQIGTPITMDQIATLTDTQLDRLGENSSLLDQVLAWTENDLAIAKAENAAADQRLAVAQAEYTKEVQRGKALAQIAEILGVKL